MYFIKIRKEIWVSYIYYFFKKEFVFGLWKFKDELFLVCGVGGRWEINLLDFFWYYIVLIINNILK